MLRLEIFQNESRREDNKMSGLFKWKWVVQYSLNLQSMSQLIF